jgi:hypothetical protein
MMRFTMLMVICHAVDARWPLVQSRWFERIMATLVFSSVATESSKTVRWESHKLGGGHLCALFVTALRGNGKHVQDYYGRDDVSPRQHKSLVRYKKNKKTLTIVEGDYRGLFWHSLHPHFSLHTLVQLDFISSGFYQLYRGLILPSFASR